MKLTRILFDTGKNISLILLVLLLFSACNKNMLFTANKEVAPPTAGVATDTVAAEKVLQQEDKILISIWDHEELSVGSLQGTYSLDETQGKWLMINPKGEVRLPQVGNVKLEGLTIAQATLQLEQVYGKYIQNPIVTVRVLNNQVTILGEVHSPGVYLFSADKIRLAELIGKAHGFTDYAKAKKIKVIRATSELAIDFTNAASVDAKELYILPGDVIYIPPTPSKSWERFNKNLIPIASLITAVALIYSISNK